MFSGPFRKLDSQMIADEITAMYKQMQQLAVVFADVSAAKRVTDTVRKRIEKFMGYLPLLHSVCNPGLRDRHWILVRL
jgi:dynein heavy chain